MPLPRHIRLRRHKRLHLPVRRNGVFEFMLHEARLKPSIEKVVINRAALGKGSIRAVNQFINQYLVQLRFWNPDAAIEVIGTTSKDSKGEENPIVVEKTGGIQEVLDLGNVTSAGDIFEKLTGVTASAELTAALQKRRQGAAAYDSHKLQQLAVQREAALASKPEGERA